jgi:dienelactone hydrolase
MSPGVFSPTGLKVAVLAGDAELQGELTVPDQAVGIVAFAHGSGSGRHSPRNRRVAGTLNEAGIATLLLDLLTEGEEQRDRVTAEYRFDIELLARRLVATVDWLRRNPATVRLPLGLFGASTGAAGALVAAAARPEDVAAVVSRGGRPDLAGPALPRSRRRRC